MFNETRLKFTFITFLILLALILFDIFQLQTTEFQSTSETIDQQNLDKFYITAPRGEIFDANGEKIAETKLEPHLFINMRKITNENSASYTQIIQYNFPDLTTGEINEIFESKEILQFVTNLSSIEYEVRNNLLTNFDAFLIIDLPIRNYIKNELYAHTIGYLGIPNQDEFNIFQNALGNKQVGKNGLERYYEEYLSGIPGELTFLGSEIIDSKQPIPGRDLFLSIDSSTQLVTKESLQQGIDLANKSFETINEIKRGASVVLDIETGNIISMVSLPDFDPNKFVSGISDFEYKQLDRDQAFNNFAIQGLYPPGSVFKVVAYWLALSENIFPEGLNNKDSKVDCEGSLSFGFDDGSQQVYNDWKLEGHGKVDLTDAIKQSCNVYFWDIALNIWRNFGNTEGESILQDYSKELGFSEKTNVDLPFEKVGIIPDRNLFEEWKISRPGLVREEGWLGGDLMNLIIGQGAITTTPLQVANAYRTLLTGENLSPTINVNAEKILNNKINVSEEFTSFLLKDLNTVTNKGGTAYVSFSILGNKVNDIGGKTGTAQNAGDKNNTSWFVGVDSISNPKYIIATVVDEGGSGSAVAAPVSRRIIQHLREYELTPVEFGEITE
jgi:penicillin-binding protein 2